MSYIDTFDHEFVGFLGGLPLYHPLEAVTGSDIAGEFSCSSSDLVLGGGDGEQPAIVLTGSESVVLNYMRTWLRLSGFKEESLTERTLAVLDAAQSPHRCLQYASWDLESYGSFYTRCTAPSYPTPYRREIFGSVEEWLVSSVGEFIYFTLPELAMPTIQMVGDLREMVKRPLLFNVTIPAPGFHVSAGRSRDKNGDIVWGNFRWNSA